VEKIYEYEKAQAVMTPAGEGESRISKKTRRYFRLGPYNKRGRAALREEASGVATWNGFGASLA